MDFLKMQQEILSGNFVENFDKYFQSFSTQISVPEINIIRGTCWLRGRKDCDTFKVSFDDYDTDIELPYFKKEIGEPPIKAAKGGRFNRDNVPYLYMTSDIYTSMAEIRLKESEVCSISNFLCVTGGVYVDVFKMLNILELKPLADILILPESYDARIYEITQFISDIFKTMGYAGILYPSTLINSGMNLLCFYPEHFQFIMYSDKIFKGISDIYGNIVPISQMDEFKRYPEYRKEMYSYGDTPEKEEAFDYIEDKIRFEDEQEYYNKMNKISGAQSTEIVDMLNDFVEYFSKTHLRKNAYQFRGTYYINNGNTSMGIRDFILSLNSCKAQWDTVIERVIGDVFHSFYINYALKNEKMKQSIIHECNLYFQESDRRWDKMMKNLKEL